MIHFAIMQCLGVIDMAKLADEHAIHYLGADQKQINK